MDTTNCSTTNSFRDETMNLESWRTTTTLTTPCTSPIDGFIGTFTVIVLIKILCSIFNTRQWIIRRANYKRPSIVIGSSTAAIRAMRTRLPIVPFLWWSMAITEVIWLILCVLNIARFDNGIGPLMFGLCFLVWGLLSFMLLHRYLTLGQRIIPLSKTTMNTTFGNYRQRGQNNNNNNNNSNGGSSSVSPTSSTMTSGMPVVPRNHLLITSLAKEDDILRFLMRSLLCTNGIQFILFCIVCPSITNHETRVQVVIAGNAVGGIFCLLLGISLAYQVNRCYNATIQICMDFDGNNTNNDQTQQPQPQQQFLTKELKRALFSMRIQQGIWMLTMSPAVIVSFLLVANNTSIVWGWPVIIFWLLLDMFVTVYATLFLAIRIVNRQQQRKKKLKLNNEGVNNNVASSQGGGGGGDGGGGGNVVSNVNTLVISRLSKDDEKENDTDD
jgi:uncharacterized membrane protein YgcG